jgi:hypothetical protein
MMPPTTTIDLIKTISRDLDRAHANRARIRQAMGDEAPTARCEERRSMLSRLFVWSRIRQQPGV